MELEVKEPLSLEDGKHEGVIERIEYRELPFRYTDVYIKEKSKELELKYGVPTSNSINSKLMKLLNKFQQLEAKQVVDPEKILIGKECVFMTMTEETEKGHFVRIVEGSVKPKVESEKI